MTSNIISFGDAKKTRIKDKITPPDFSEEDETAYIDGISAAMVSDIVEMLATVEYDVRDNPETIKDIMNLMEAVRSIIHRCKGEKYVYHKLVDAMFKETFIDITEEESLNEFIIDMEINIDTD